MIWEHVESHLPSNSNKYPSEIQTRSTNLQNLYIIRAISRDTYQAVEVKRDVLPRYRKDASLSRIQWREGQLSKLQLLTTTHLTSYLINSQRQQTGIDMVSSAETT